jgi:hypothetical protein
MPVSTPSLTFAFHGEVAEIMPRLGSVCSPIIIFIEIPFLLRICLTSAKFMPLFEIYDELHVCSNIPSYERRTVAKFTYRHLKPDRRCCSRPYRRLILFARQYSRVKILSAARDLVVKDSRK